MKVHLFSIALLRVISVVGVLLLACNLINISVQFREPSATPTSTSTDTPTFTPTLQPTETSTPILTSTPTLIPSPTSIPATYTPSLAHIEVVNSLSIPLKVTLRGPTPKTFTINANASKTIDIEPGSYEFTLEATGFYPLNGNKTFTPGYNRWAIVKEKQ